MSQPERSSQPSFFRQKALEYHQKGGAQEGDVLHLSPVWMKRAYWLIIAMSVAGLFFCIVGSLCEFASGSAVVRMVGRTDLTMSQAGVVLSVEVQPGQPVEAGQTLVTFMAEEERNAVARLRQEIDAQLVRFMRDPLDQSARQSLTALNAELEHARARLEARTLKAPFAGVLGDVRVQPGHYLAPGARVLSIHRADAPTFLMAFLPGHYRPLLKPGMPLRVELEGFRYEYQDLIIDSVASQIIGPDELRRFLGPDLGDAVKLEGPIVLVKARIPESHFVSEGQSFNYFDGMPANVRVPVRMEPIWTLMVPGWRGLFSHGS
ncbi:hemolysin D [Archangium sp. Cb G35]|uniref:efflux RND transporter periplasmic adaptor subunit n=1 Tax=Archangium sp. Cb G35 TaxID=1920190 RepID=UPI0009359C9F|nr:HlyD family efflux transporter periplasmic adaptor subunit [Archangium sp. Cb G35]OJT26582.1 hemolysin D [Archangium sp. Cb G35]